MPLSIKDPEADRLARALAKETGESLTQAIVGALRERLARERRSRAQPARREKLRAIRESMRDVPRKDLRSEDEILGYGPDGLPR